MNKKYLFGLGIILPCAASAQTAQRPNILMVVSDDHSAVSLGCYGNPDVMTPNIDSLAARGVRFNRAYCASPQSVPARAAIFTGRSPVAVDMTRFNVTLDREFKTFPEYLRDSGYYVGVAGRGYHMDGAVSGTVGRIKEVELYYRENGYCTFADRLDTCMVVAKARNGKYHSDINHQFREFMSARDRSKPFFLQLNYSDPHRPYDAPKAHNPQNLQLPYQYPDTQLVREDLSAYYDEIHRMDSDFGEVMQYLAEQELSKNTIVIFTGDNGAAQFLGKGTLYELGIKIPLIICWPNHYPKGTSVDAIVSHEDLAPTILAVAGVEKSSKMTGMDISSLIMQCDTTSRKYAYAMRGCHATNSLPYDTSVFDQMRCIVGRRYKLIYNLLAGLPSVPIDFAQSPMWQELIEMDKNGNLDKCFHEMYFIDKRPMFELYDLENDPHERNNLIDIPEYGEIQRELILELTYRMIRDRDFVTLPHPKLYE